MKSISMYAVVVAVISLFAMSALAGPADSMLASLTKANDSLNALVNTTDKAQQSTLQGDITKESSTVEDNLKTALSDKKTSMMDSVKFKAIKEVWNSYKKTRDKDVIPAAMSGKIDQAKEMTKSLNDRFGKMKELLNALGAK